MVVLAALAAVHRPDPDLLVALTVVFPGLGCLLVADRAFDIRSNRRDHIVERAAHTLGLVRALEHGQSKAPARHTAAARLPIAIRRLCRELKREAGRDTTPTTRRLTAQLRYSARQALGASASEERERERERLKLVLASVLACHSGRGAAGGLPVDPKVIDEAAVAAMTPGPRDGAGWVVGGGLMVLFCVCAFSYLAALARVPADAQHLVAPTIAVLGGYWLRSRRITEAGAAAPSSPGSESGSATAD